MYLSLLLWFSNNEFSSLAHWIVYLYFLRNHSSIHYNSLGVQSMKYLLMSSFNSMKSLMKLIIVLSNFGSWSSSRQFSWKNHSTRLVGLMEDILSWPFIGFCFVLFLLFDLDMWISFFGYVSDVIDWADAGDKWSEIEKVKLGDELFNWTRRWFPNHESGDRLMGTDGSGRWKDGRRKDNLPSQKKESKFEGYPSRPILVIMEITTQGSTEKNNGR